MKYCTKCGSQLAENQTICSFCGANVYGSTTNPNGVVDTGGFGWGLLAFCLPVVGLILYLIWKDERPNTAKSIGIGLLVSLIPFLLGLMVSFLVAIYSGNFS